MRSTTIPLFPLQMVLFPSVPLPLHIFEERYRIMINQCIEENEPFGVVYQHASEIERVGCTATVNHILNRYDDGRLDIMSVGVDRFRVEAVDDSAVFLRARVTILDEGAEPIDQQVYDRAVQRLLAYAEMSDLDISAATLDGLNANQLSFLIAGVESLPLDTKQSLLELNSPLARLERSVAAIERVNAELKLFRRVRKLVGTDVDVKAMLN